MLASGGVPAASYSASPFISPLLITNLSELARSQGSVVPPRLSHKLRVSAELEHATAAHHGDGVGRPDGGQAVRDDDHG